jgi:acyl-CoA thioesterase
MTRFDRDTAATRVRGGHFRVHLCENWWVGRGANGGYLAALLLRSLLAQVAPEHPPRSLTIHFLGTPSPGAAEIETCPERVGRSLSSWSARLRQEGRPIAVALAAFGSARKGLRFARRSMPDAPPPEACRRLEGFHPMHGRWEFRWAFGEPPGSNAPLALAGGWIRPGEPRRADALQVAAMCDAFPPTCFSMAPEPDSLGPIPTAELTIHFRRTLPLATARPEDFLLARFESRTAVEGFVEEDGELWSADGVLLAECRQLALFI